MFDGIDNAILDVQQLEPEYKPDNGAIMLHVLENLPLEFEHLRVAIEDQATDITNLRRCLLRYAASMNGRALPPGMMMARGIPSAPAGPPTDASAGLRLASPKPGKDVPKATNPVFWRQGAGDVAHLDWKQYGSLSIRLFRALREETGTPQLPIIDEANPNHPHIQTGKLYAAKVLCDATTNSGVTGGVNPLSTCVVTPSEACPNDTVVDPRPWNQFGWDSAVPDSLKPPGFSPKTSKWFVRWSDDPSVSPNLHDDYEAMVWIGRAMAMALIREHSAFSVPEAMAEWDLWALFRPSRARQQPRGPRQTYATWTRAPTARTSRRPQLDAKM